MYNLNLLPSTRRGWLIPSFFALGIFCLALWFQHVNGMQPCVKCIEERTLIISFFFVGLIASMKPSNAVFRVAGYIAFITIGFIGFDLASEHIDMQNGSGGLFATCSIFPRFPIWMPLHEWIPEAFMPTGTCDRDDWAFLSLTMVEWVRVIFASYIALPFVYITLKKGI